MRKKTFTVLLVLVTALAGIGLASLLAVRGQPSYQGRSLSWWLKDYDDALRANFPSPSASDPRELRDEKAIAAMGTNAVPLLLTWISARDKPNSLPVIANKMSARFPWLTWSPISAVIKNRIAYEGFHALGREIAETVRPQLTALTTNVPAGVSAPMLGGVIDYSAFYAGGVLRALDGGATKGGFDPCLTLRPLFFPMPNAASPASSGANLPALLPQSASVNFPTVNAPPPIAR